MAVIVPKSEILVDLTRPVEEIQACIVHIVDSHPGQQLNLLNQVDMWLGELIRKMESKINEKKEEPVVNSAEI